MNLCWARMPGEFLQSHDPGHIIVTSMVAAWPFEFQAEALEMLPNFMHNVLEAARASHMGSWPEALEVPRKHVLVQRWPMARHSRRDQPNQTCLPMWLAHPRALQLLGSRCAACPCCQTAGAWQSSLVHVSGEKPPAWGEAHPKSRRTLMLLGQGSYGRERNSACDFGLC